LHNSVDKTLISNTCTFMTIAGKLAMMVGALIAMLMIKSSVTIQDSAAVGSLVKGFSGLIILALLSITLLLSLLFKEVSLQNRISHYTDGKQLKLLQGVTSNV
jgi:hypothetical protein